MVGAHLGPGDSDGNACIHAGRRGNWRPSMRTPMLQGVWTGRGIGILRVGLVRHAPVSAVGRGASAQL